MITVCHEFDIDWPQDRVWSLISNFDAFARCVPTLVEHQTTGPDRATGVVGVTLGAIPVRSRVEVEVTERRPPHCLKGRAVSFLGETISEQLRQGRPGTVGIADVGRIEIHLDLTPLPSGGTHLRFVSEVVAEGKLARIYEAILRLKAEALKAEFERNIRQALGRAEHDDAGVIDARPGMFARLGSLARRLWKLLNRVLKNEL